MKSQKMQRMKKIICSLILLCSWSLYAQETDDYRPFIEEGKVWHSFHYDQWGMYHRYCFFDGDTIVGGRHCKKWLQRIEPVERAWSRTDTLALYEENRQVWFYYDTASSPCLMFDFGAHIGDTITVTDSNGLLWWMNRQANQSSVFLEKRTKNIIIAQKNTQRVWGETIMETRFLRIDEPTEDQLQFNYVWEGIGSRFGPVFWTGWYDGWQAWNDLVCCSVDEKILYFDVEAANRWGIPIPTSIRSLQIVNSKSSNCQYYDLTGRRLAAPPSKGIYIENGRKKVGR